MVKKTNYKNGDAHLKRSGKKRGSRKLYGGADSKDDIIKRRLLECISDNFKVRICIKTAQCKWNEHTRDTTLSLRGILAKKIKQIKGE